MRHDLLTPDAGGLYCAAGDFWIDPLRPVLRAIITHAHADHARSGSGQVWAAAEGLALLGERIGQAGLEGLDYGETLTLGDCSVSLHPAGHIRGSATVRIAHGGEVWGVSGDFKRAPDPTCSPFEVFGCDVWVSECTFGLPIYRWPPVESIVAEIIDWAESCFAQDRNAVLFCYALGKAQRLLAELAAAGFGHPVWLHGAMARLTGVYRDHGIVLPETPLVSEQSRGQALRGALVLAPPSAAGSPWMRRVEPCGTGFVSGWMQVRGNRRRRGYDRGFVLSDHADWPALVDTALATGAGRVITIHGQGEHLARHLADQGLETASWNLRAGLS